nr:hypothetical protein Iba_chr01aCG6330 [Ipomoea batatas]GMD52568.1 hypothetical protein Iba_chr11bCG12860 [Ipomoea batatas]
MQGTGRATKQRRTKQSVAVVSGSINGQRQRKRSSGDQLKIDGRTTSMVFSISPMVSSGVASLPCFPGEETMNQQR